MGVFVRFRFEKGEPVVLPGIYVQEDEINAIRGDCDYIGYLQEVVQVNADGSIASDGKVIKSDSNKSLFGIISWYTKKFPAFWIFAVSTKKEADLWIRHSVLSYNASNGEKAKSVEIFGITSVPSYRADIYNEVMFGPGK